MFKFKHKDLIEAGHFTVYHRRWMNDTTIWYWRKGTRGDPQGPFHTKEGAEDAAYDWYQASLKP